MLTGRGWKELYSIGFAEKLPSTVAIQAEGSCPIVKAFKAKKEFVAPIKEARTIAHSISNPDPSKWTTGAEPLKGI